MLDNVHACWLTLSCLILKEQSSIFCSLAPEVEAAPPYICHAIKYWANLTHCSLTPSNNKDNRCCLQLYREAGKEPSLLWFHKFIINLIRKWNSHISSIYLGVVKVGLVDMCKCREPYWGDSRKPFVRVMAKATGAAVWDVDSVAVCSSTRS
jgi:hypothetical protein